ncbi:MAG TPA: 3-oxoacyl-ACP reductase [Bacillota bacterium]|nr:3-oxoacyl-ACP reductase [Bacillota bacterium]
MKLTEQVVLITGASRGLGREIANAFHREGANVVINYFQSKDKAEALVNELGQTRAIAIQADVREQTEVEEMFKRARDHFKQPIATVVNNALMDFKFDPVKQKDAEAIGWDEYAKQFAGSIKAPLYTIQAALPAMKDNKFGRIINIGTNLFQNPVVPYHEYTTAKAALLGFTRNMARDLGPHNITVNMVSGGLLQKTDASSATTDEVFELIRESTPMQQVTTPEDLAQAVLFFASPWARAVTGQNLVVDRGLVMD